MHMSGCCTGTKAFTLQVASHSCKGIAIDFSLVHISAVKHVSNTAPGVELDICKALRQHATDTTGECKSADAHGVRYTAMADGAVSNTFFLPLCGLLSNWLVLCLSHSNYDCPWCMTCSLVHDLFRLLSAKCFVGIWCKVLLSVCIMAR